MRLIWVGSNTVVMIIENASNNGQQWRIFNKNQQNCPLLQSDVLKCWDTSTLGTKTDPSSPDSLLPMMLGGEWL